MIEVGEYVRTKRGIAKIIKYIGQERKRGNFYQVDKNGTIKTDSNFNEYILEDDVIKHNKIISEIVEAGDYVNGKLIHKVDKGPNYCYLYYGNCKTFVNYQIKSVVTHEQFESIEYNVEEDK